MELTSRPRSKHEADAARRDGPVFRRPTGASPSFSHETLFQWSRWTARQRFEWREHAAFVVLAVLAHLSLGLALLFAPTREFDLDAPRPVKVTFLEGTGKKDEPVQKGEELSTPPLSAREPAARAATQGAPGTPAKAPPKARRAVPKSPARVEPSVRTDGLAQGPAVPAPAPQDDAPTAPSDENAPQSRSNAETPADQLAPPSLPKGLRRFLPGNNASYTDRQRVSGDTIGSDAIGGDLPEPEATVDPTDRPIVVEREYSLAHYFDNLNRRFSDAWGPTRTLPPDSNFTGVVGEQIVYNIVINRDGSLRKIINKTALAQPWRRFDDVDRIVRDVFSNVFPLPSVPGRILQDPVVLTKRIQYTGYTYSMY